MPLSLTAGTRSPSPTPNTGDLSGLAKQTALDAEAAAARAAEKAIQEAVELKADKATVNPLTVRIANVEAVTTAKADASSLQPVQDAIAALAQDDALDDAALSALKTIVDAIKVPDVSTKAEQSSLVAEIADRIAGDADLEAAIALKADKATVDAIAIPDLAPYLKSADAASLYALKAALDEYTKTADLWLVVATQAWVNSQLDDINALLNSLPDRFAKKSELPDLSPYAKKTDIPAIPDFPVYDLSSYAKITDLPEIPAFPDLSMYATHDQLVTVDRTTNTRLNGLESDRVTTAQLGTEVTDRTAGDAALDTRVTAAEAKNTAQDAAIALKEDKTVVAALDVAYKAADTALGTRITTVESRIVDPDTTAWTHAGGNTELKIVIPDRFGAQPDTLSFRLYDRRTSTLPNRFKDISVPFNLFNANGGSGWNAWIDTAFPTALWQDVTFPDSAVMRIHLHYFVTPQGTISLDFFDSHANANNTYGAVGNIRVTYSRKVVTNVVSVPMGTTVRKVCTVTANDGALTVNGLGSDILYTGTSGRIKVSVPSGQEILSVTAPSGIAVAIADPVMGALEVAISDTFTATTANLSVIFQQVQARSLFTTFNAGVWVSFKTVQLTVATSGNRSLQIRSVSGSINLRWITYIAWDNSHVPLFTASVAPSSTQYLKSDWNFGATGNNQTAIVEDVTNNKRYRIVMQINSSFNNNILVIEDIS